MNILFDAKNKYEVRAAKAALDFLEEQHSRREEERANEALPSTIRIAREPSPRPFVNRNRKDVVLEERLSDRERRTYPGLYRLAVMVYEWMEPNKLYTIKETKAMVMQHGHAENSAAAVLSHLVKLGYAERPMKALYQRRERKHEGNNGHSSVELRNGVS